MNNSLFPIEVCEYIIDSCRAGLRGGSNASYATWCQTALVCSAWLPRSRFNLFYEVELTADSHVGLLLRTLQETPHFADMVVRLAVYHGAKNPTYVPFSRLSRPQLLKKCVVLDLSEVYWDLYPPRYSDTCLYGWSGMVVLRLKIQSRVLKGCLRFIWSLRQLQSLSLLWNYLDSSAESTHSRTAPGPKGGRCKNLRSLKLEV